MLSTAGTLASTAARHGPAIGLTVQTLLLAALALATDIGVQGLLGGLAYGLATYVALTIGLRRTGSAEFGPADGVTLARATLVGCVTALTVQAFRGPVPVALLVAVCVVALVLDNVDGRVARRTHTESPFGARFDMEVDAFLILVLSVYVALALGPWVLAIGLMRYALLVATGVVPWLRGPVPPRYWRKVVAAIQGIVLTVAAADVLPVAPTVAGVAVSLALLVESFGRDVVWQWRQHRRRAPRSPGRGILPG